MSATTTIRPATQNDLSRISTFLRDNGLPTNGVDKCVENFVVAIESDGSWVGIAGLERYGKSALLRSVAVDKRFRGIGHGRRLVDVILRNAKANGITTVYLLTEGAETYFQGLGFEVVDRNRIDETVRTSPEFTECCETAVAMRKRIG